MGMRKYRRQVAKARMKVVGFERINKNFSVKNADGIPNWRLALMDKKAEQAQAVQGMRTRRKLRKLERTA